MAKKILISGNEAFAKGAIQAGCRFYAGYPITPQNELIAYMAKHMALAILKAKPLPYRLMPQADGIFIQAESELAAINMVYGASAAGVRAMTSSSSPGMSLKQEGISYIAGAELPAVIVNVMRGGPGLGNIAPAQSDYFQATRGGGHGDYHSIVLAPASVQEAYEIMFAAFNLADEYRNPVIILGDSILGQMMEPIVVYSPERAARRNKVPAKHWALTGCKGRKPNVVKSFYLKEGVLEKFNLSLQKKYKVIQDKEQRWEEFFVKDADQILVAYGTMARITKNVVNKLREKGKKIGLIRPISLWPFPEKIFDKLASRSSRIKFLVVEMSYGQMLQDVKLAVNGRYPVEFLGRAGGGIPSEEEIIKSLARL